MKTSEFKNVTLQAGVAEDLDYRLSPGTFAGVLRIAGLIFGSDDLDAEIEYEDWSISQFPVLTGSVADGALSFRLGSKHTEYRAKDVCVPQSGGGCGPDCCKGPARWTSL